MANSFSGINNSILSRRIFENFVARLAPLSAFSTSMSDEVQEASADVTAIVTKAYGTVLTKTVGAAYTVQDVQNSTVKVTLKDEPDYVSWHLTDTEVAKSSLLNMEVFAAQKAYGLAKSVLTDVFGAVTVANYGAAGWGGAAAQFDRDVIADLCAYAEGLDLQLDMCSLVVKPSYYWNLVKGLDASTYGGNEAIRSGRIPGLFGFRQVMSSNVIPTNSENLVGFIAHPGCMAVAMRYLKPQEGNTYTQARPFTDPESGITLGLREYYDNPTGRLIRIMEAIWGKTAVAYDTSDKTKNGLIRIASAAE